MESFSPGCSGLGSPDRGRQYVVTTRTPPLGSRECRSGPASASNASISASPLAIGKPHSIILHELPRLGISLRGLQVTQGEFIYSMCMLHRHNGAIGLVQEGDGQHGDPSPLANRPALIFYHGGGKREDQMLLQVGMPGPERRQRTVTHCPVHDRLNPLALFSPEIEPACLGLKLCGGCSHIVLGVTCCYRFHFFRRHIHLYPGQSLLFTPG